ncbi:putative disease resistance protein At1g50180 [Macadamia integrifolia]|uniref:putative disease resistance protein At1g50180 n=1 Tax=Macadamia integrifolia TaxID=60698 RepID=UPI001C4EE956|nr:putative disease resistance protein At1g50180 [Macadamia integrifolia]
MSAKQELKMAEGAVSFVIGKLGLLISQEGSFLGRVKTQIMSLREELEWISSFLRDADEKRRRNEWVNVWVNQVSNLAFDAEVINDLFIFEVQQQRQRNIGLRCMGYPKHLFTLHKFGNQIEDIKRRIGEISANRSKYGTETLETGGGTSSRLNDGIAWKLRRASMEEEVDVVGFDQDIETLAKLLIKQDHPQARQLLVVSIVGMGGSGKTTLARSIYNKSYVKNTFDSYAWIYVSQEYRIKDLLFEVITQVMMPTEKEKKKLKEKNEDELREKLSNDLKERRCLFVDDVWKMEDWDILKMAFLSHYDERKQQRVLLTTRKVEVAKYADPSTDPRELNALGDEESFELFSKKVFLSQSGSD